MVAPCTYIHWCRCSFLQTLWRNMNNYLDIQWKTIQFRFTMFCCMLVYNSLSDPTSSLKENNVLKYKLIRKHKPCTYPSLPINQLINWLFVFIFDDIHKLFKIFFWHHKITSNHLYNLKMAKIEACSHSYQLYNVITSTWYILWK